MRENRVGRLPKEESRREEEWENALAGIMARDELDILVEDCDELHLRLRQVLHRHPERASLLAPGIERAEDMRRRIVQLRARCERSRELFIKWKEEFDK